MKKLSVAAAFLIMLLTSSATAQEQQPEQSNEARTEIKVGCLKKFYRKKGEWRIKFRDERNRMVKLPIFEFIMNSIKKVIDATKPDGTKFGGIVLGVEDAANKKNKKVPTVLAFYFDDTLPSLDKCRK